MDHLMLSCFIVWSVTLHRDRTIHATPLLTNLSIEGSGYWEDGKSERIPIPSVTSNNLEILEPTAISTGKKGTHLEHYFITKMVDILRENLFLILVITVLLVVVFLIVCSAVVLSHRRKVSTYYPCSFPAKMYVDKADKTGGGQVFSDVPEKLASRTVEEPVNSAKQLQDDIILATGRLWMPTKAPWREEKNMNPVDMESNPRANEEREKSLYLSKENNTQQPVSNKAKEEISSKALQDTLPVCHMEKPDLSSTDLLLECEHPSSSDILEAREETDKQEAVASAVGFISQERATF
ncbi:transmembrane protein 119b [Colossoma macropomum]|uniref:transmembrane protein 119b n=1 Tax=Colossoma macropomum TaxID=42526 RepID=UPI0018644A78|nr:transmembrane protein 119b [Colossoma macropomum]